jgi:hypothetical protein
MTKEGVIMSHAKNAQRCFDENITMFGNANSQPEKYNLYNGLRNLAQAVGDMQSEIHRLKQEVDYLRRNS